MKTIKSISLIVLILSTTSCSPFGAGSVIESIGKSIVDLFQTKTSVEVISGGRSEETTEAGYKVTLSIGNQYNQSGATSEGGYQVFSTVQSN